MDTTEAALTAPLPSAPLPSAALPSRPAAVGSDVWGAIDSEIASLTQRQSALNAEMTKKTAELATLRESVLVVAAMSSAPDHNALVNNMKSFADAMERDKTVGAAKTLGAQTSVSAKAKPKRVPPPPPPPRPPTAAKKAAAPAKLAKVSAASVAATRKTATAPSDAKENYKRSMFSSVANPTKMKRDDEITGPGSCSSFDSSSSSGASSSAASEFSSGAESCSSDSLPSSGSSGSEDRVRSVRKKRVQELMQEKVEMLTRISNMSKAGFLSTRKWGIKDDIDEIRFECYRMQRESNCKKSVAMMRQVMVSVTTLVEMANSYFNPFNLRLDGFSKSMMLSMSNYDDCFDKLHHKYSGRTSMGPELQLAFTFASAAVFHHAGNAMKKDDTKKTTSPVSAMSAVLGMLGGASSSSGGSARASAAPRAVVTPKDSQADAARMPQVDPPRRAMRGPTSSSIPAAATGAVPSMRVPETA